MKARSAAAQGLALGVAAAALWWIGRNIAITLGDNEKLDAGGIEVEALFTPGHAAGHLSVTDRHLFVTAGDESISGPVERVSLS